MQLDSWVNFLHLVTFILAVLVVSSFYCAWFENNRLKPEFEDGLTESTYAHQVNDNSFPLREMMRELDEI